MLAEWVHLTFSQVGSADGLTKWVQLLMSHSPALAGGIHEGNPLSLFAMILGWLTKTLQFTFAMNFDSVADSLFVRELRSFEQQQHGDRLPGGNLDPPGFEDIFLSIFDEGVGEELPASLEVAVDRESEAVPLEAVLFSGMPGRLAGTPVADGAFDEDAESAASEVEPQQTGPSAEQVSIWVGEVLTEGKHRVWKEHSGSRFQSRCFSVEWKGSALLDEQQFLRELFRVFGGELSFVLGVEARQTRADYLLVVRMKGQKRWRDWREKLMFGHGGDMGEAGLFIRLRVPRRGTDDGVNLFVRHMKRRCGEYPQVFRFREEEMEFSQARGHGGTRRQKVKTADIWTDVEASL